MIEVQNNTTEEEQPVKALEEIGPEEFLVKHPLQNRWTLWFYDHGRSKVWEENQREIISFDTIEDFWGLFNHIKTASELRQGCDYSLFKQGIRPMWEDQANIKGGRWLLNFDRKQRNEDVDKYWLEMVLMLIGETFEGLGDDVCGAVVNIRAKGDKIGLWTADTFRTASILDIGKRMRNQMRLPPHYKLEYQAHKDQSAKSG